MSTAPIPALSDLTRRAVTADAATVAAELWAVSLHGDNTDANL